MTVQANQEPEVPLPTVLLFDAVLHGTIIVFRDKETPTDFWGFKENGAGDYLVSRVDYVGAHLKGSPVYDSTDLPLFIVQEPDISAKIVVDFIDWLYTDGTPL